MLFQELYTQRRWALQLKFSVAIGLLVSTLISGQTSSSSEVSADISAMTLAATLHQQISTLASTASAPTEATVTNAELTKTAESISNDILAIGQLLENLANSGHRDTVARMRQNLSKLSQATERLAQSRANTAKVLLASQVQRQNLITNTTWQLLPAALASEDNLFYRLVSESGSSGTDTQAVSFNISPEDLLLYERLALILKQIDQGYIVLEAAARLTDNTYIATAEEIAHLAIYQLRENLQVLSQQDVTDLDPALLGLAQQLVDSTYGESNILDLMKERLRAVTLEGKLATEIKANAASLQMDASEIFRRTVASYQRTSTNEELANALEAIWNTRNHLISLDSIALHATRPQGSASIGSPAPNASAERLRAIRQGIDQYRQVHGQNNIDHLTLGLDDLEETVSRIERGRSQIAASLQSAADERIELRNFFKLRLSPAVVTSYDNQIYYMLTGRSSNEEVIESDVASTSITDFLRLRHLALTQDSIFRIFSGLMITIIVTEPTLLGESEERFLTASHRLERSLEFLENSGGPEIEADLIPLARKFIAYGREDASLFDSLRNRLSLIRAEQVLLETGERQSSSIKAELDTLLGSLLDEIT